MIIDFKTYSLLEKQKLSITKLSNRVINDIYKYINLENNKFVIDELIDLNFSSFNGFEEFFYAYEDANRLLLITIGDDKFCAVHLYTEIPILHNTDGKITYNNNYTINSIYNRFIKYNKDVKFYLLESDKNIKFYTKNKKDNNTKNNYYNDIILLIKANEDVLRKFYKNYYNTIIKSYKKYLDLLNYDDDIEIINILNRDLNLIKSFIKSPLSSYSLIDTNIENYISDYNDSCDFSPNGEENKIILPRDIHKVANKITAMVFKRNNKEVKIIKQKYSLEKLKIKPFLYKDLIDDIFDDDLKKEIDYLENSNKFDIL